MAKQDDTAALAEALREPLDGADLEAALRAARASFMRDPGDEGAKRVVEALELLMAQVWFGGAEDGEAPDPRYAAAAQHLESVDLPAALACYESVTANDPSIERARRLALRVKVVMAARAGAALPPDVRVAPNFAPAAFPEEPTRALMPGDYEFVDDAFDEDDERTRVRPAASGGEVTRVAADGELPLEELRREMERDTDGALDALLDEMASSERSSVRNAPSAPELEAVIFPDDAVHAPLQAARPSQGDWTISEPGSDDDDSGPHVGIPSWTGVAAFETAPSTFEPEAGPVEADTWDEPTEATPPRSPEEHAEALVAEGELGEALRIYQELAASRDDPALWDRVAEIARLLQARSR